MTTAIGNYAGAVSLALQPDGKAIAGGWSNAGPSFALARYNDDGSLDSSFGDGGVRTYPVGAHGADGTSVLLQHLPDGRDRLVQTGHPVGRTKEGRFAAIGLQVDRGFGARRLRRHRSSTARAAASRPLLRLRRSDTVSSRV